MSYVDGYVLPVPEKNIDAYREIAEKAAAIWMEHGALDYKECIAEDVNIDGFVPFTKVIEAKQGETVIFAYIVYRSRKHRDEVNAKAMSDPRLKEYCGHEKEMPFDCKRMAYGGFKVLVTPGDTTKSDI